MSAIPQITLPTAAGIALAVFAFGCGEQSEAPAPAKPAVKAPAQPAAEAPAPAAKPDAAPAAAEAVEPDVAAGKADYQIFCASCHGPTGDGDGPVAQALDPKPARHSDGNYMNALEDDYLFQVIKFGGASVGKSPMMAPVGGSLSDQQIRNVIAFIRSLADPPYQP
jgi:mono/diheme cytochrome c family protein